MEALKLAAFCLTIGLNCHPKTDINLADYKKLTPNLCYCVWEPRMNKLEPIKDSERR